MGDFIDDHLGPIVFIGCVVCLVGLVFLGIAEDKDERRRSAEYFASCMSLKDAQYGDCRMKQLSFENGISERRSEESSNMATSMAAGMAVTAAASAGRR